MAAQAGKVRGKVVDGLDSTDLGELLRLLAHDLRNPLSALDSNVSFLESELEAESAAARESLDDLKLSCDGLARIVDSVEVLGRFLQGQATEEKRSAPLGPLLGTAVELARSQARSHGVGLAVAEDCLTCGIDVVVGREMFVRATRALLQNSIQHAPQSSRVAVRLRELPEGMVVLVEDAGPRLSEDMQERAFTAAGQLGAKRRGGGRYSNGLGLFCARICAEAAGARVRAVSSPTGNVFEVIAPRA